MERENAAKIGAAKAKACSEEKIEMQFLASKAMKFKIRLRLLPNTLVPITSWPVW